MAKRPAVIGRYQIVDRIGQGGMGSLYRAWDPMLERQIAIKLLRDDNDELRERFAREARSAARLRHRNIVTIFDVGEQDGHPFIAMEYIQGQTLAELIRAGAPISTLRKLQIIDELCDGLAFAHKAGIVHRDVKPPNVMVEHDGTVKILDFGIVRLAESGMTQAGMLIGTVNYMSPEQVAGQPVDLRSDIFAVGAVFYELLSCQQAFHGGLHNGILNRILHHPAPPLLERCPELDPEIVRIVEQALEKDPATRYQDLAVMRNDLQRAEVRLGLAPTDTGRRHITDAESTSINLQAPTAPASRPATPRLGAYREDLARRRASQIAAHLEHAQQALAEGEYEVVMAAAEQALLLDAEEPEALDLLERARSAVETRQLQELLRRAEERLQAGALTEAGQLAAEAVTQAPEAAAARALQAAVREARRARDRARARAAAIAAGLERARAGLQRGALDEAEAAVAEVLEVAPELGEAQALRDQARAARTRQAQDAADRAAAAAVAEAEALFATGREGEAVGNLERFEPAHAVVTAALTRLRAEHERREQERAAVRARAEQSAAALAAARSTAGHAEAIRILEAAQRGDPGHAELSAVLADRRAALEEQQRELRERRAQVASAVEKARRTKSHEEAIGCLEQALELEPEHAEARQLLTARRAAQEREAAIAAALTEAKGTAGHEAALEILRRAAALDPKHPAVREEVAAREAALEQERAEARRARKRAEQSAAAVAAARSTAGHEEAIRILEAAQRGDPGHAELSAVLAERRAAHDEELRLARKRREQVAAAVAHAARAASHEDAIPLLKRALELEPANTEVARLLQERQSALEREREEHRRTLEREAAVTALLTEARATASHEKALEILRRAAALDPRHQLIQDQIAVRGAELERERAEARQAQERAEKIAAAIAAAERMSSHETALDTLRNALTLDPDHAELRRLIAERRAAHDEGVRLARERRDKVRAAIENARHSESHEEAIACLEQALELEPTHVLARRLLTERRATLEREREAARVAQSIAAALAEAASTPGHEAAVAILQRAAALDPKHSAVRDQLAVREAALAHERDEARKAQERRARIDAALTAARQASSHDIAIRTLEAALQIDAVERELEELLGQRRAAREEEQRQAEERRQRVAAAVAKAEATGSHEAAIEVLQAALTLDPGSAELQQLLRARRKALDEAREAARQAEAREARITSAITAATATASHEKAVVLLERAVAADPGDPRLEALLPDRTAARDREREEIRQQKKRSDKAAALVKQAKTTASHEAALALLAEALALDPEHPEARAVQATRQVALEQQRAEEQRQAELAATRQTISELIDRQQFDEAAIAIAQAKATLNAGKTLKDFERRLAKARRAHVPPAAAAATKESPHGVRLGVRRPLPLLAAAAALLILILGGVWWQTTRDRSSQTTATTSDQAVTPAAAPPVAAPSSAPPGEGSPPSSTATNRSEPAAPAPVDVPPTGGATPAAPSVPSPSVDIAELVRLGRRQLARGELRQALSTIAPGLESEPQHPELRKVLGDIVLRSRRQANTARIVAGRHGEAATGQSAYRDGNSKFEDAAKLERAGQSQQAASLFWDATALFDKAEKDTRESLARATPSQPTPSQPAEQRPAEQPSAAPGREPTTPVTGTSSPKTIPETPGPVEPRPSAPVNPAPKPATASGAADEAGIRNTLGAYAQAWTSRDVDGVIRVFPSMRRAALVRSFGDMRAQEMKIDKCEPTPVTDNTVTVVCQVYQSFTPSRGSKYSPGTLRTVFRLEKSGDSWIILERR